MRNRTLIDYHQAANDLYVQAQGVINIQQKYELLQTAVTELGQLENKQNDHWRLLSKICMEIAKIYFGNSRDQEAINYFKSALQKLTNVEAIEEDRRMICEVYYFLMYAQLNLNHMDSAREMLLEGISACSNVVKHSKAFNHPNLYLEHFEKSNTAYTNSTRYQQQKQKLLNYFEECKVSEIFRGMQFSPLINGSVFPRPQDEDDMMDVDTDEYNPSSPQL